MTDTTTFELRLPAAALAAFGADLAALAEAAGDDAAGGAPSAATLRQLLEALAGGHRKDCCLTLAFAEDAELRAFRDENPGLRARRPGQVAVGCFWMRAQRVDGDVRVAFDSATRSISWLMKASPSVREAFRALGRHARDGEVRVIDEWHAVAPL